MDVFAKCLRIRIRKLLLLEEIDCKKKIHLEDVALQPIQPDLQILADTAKRREESQNQKQPENSVIPSEISRSNINSNIDTAGARKSEAALTAPKQDNTAKKGSSKFSRVFSRLTSTA